MWSPQVAAERFLNICKNLKDDYSTMIYKDGGPCMREMDETNLWKKMIAKFVFSG